MNIQHLTSVNNEIVKQTKALHSKKARNELGLFLIEGDKGVIQAIKDKLQIESIFINEKIDNTIINNAKCNIYKVNEKILKKISTTDSPTNIIAVVKQVKWYLEDVLKQKHPLILILEDIKDPGNLGTIIRTAAAGEIAGIILTENTVDIYNPKTVRSTVANLWRVPIINMPEKEKIKNTFKDYHFIATSVNNDKQTSLYYNIDYKKPTVLMFGSEAKGLSEELFAIADELITIPMNEQVESLNLSISVGVIIYDAVRQRLCNK